MKIRNKIEICIMVLLLAVAVFVVNVITPHQFTANEIRVKNFFLQEKSSLDVVTVGASEMYTGFSPQYIWKNYGITSYNLATQAAPMKLAQSQIKSALKTQKPQLLVISMNGAVYGDKRASHEGYTRMWLDNITDDKLHKEAIEDLIKGNKDVYRFKFLKYHTNIGRLPECFDLFKREIKSKKERELLVLSSISGTAATDNRDLSKLVDENKYKERLPLGKKTEKDLYKLLNYLKAEKIENVCFVNMPRFYDEKMLKSKGRINTAMDIVKSYGFDAYDFDKDVAKIGLDPKMDFYNTHHLNIYGQKKMSKYFYDKIAPKYGVAKSNHNDKVVGQWNRDYEAWIKVDKWIDHQIRENSEGRYKYDYKVVDHIVNGTIDEYESTLRLKSDIKKKKIERRHQRINEMKEKKDV